MVHDGQHQVRAFRQPWFWEIAGFCGLIACYGAVLLTYRPVFDGRATLWFTIGVGLGAGAMFGLSLLLLKSGAGYMALVGYVLEAMVRLRPLSWRIAMFANVGLGLGLAMLIESSKPEGVPVAKGGEYVVRQINGAERPVDASEYAVLDAQYKRMAGRSIGAGAILMCSFTLVRAAAITRVRNDRA